MLSSVTALDGGGFVVTWGSAGQDGPDFGIYGQRYGASGGAIGPEFRVNTTTSGQQEFPSVTGLNDGGFIVTRSSNGQDGSGHGIYGQRYEAGGAAVGPEFRVNTTTGSDQLYSSVTALDDGGFVVTWSALGQDRSGFGIYGQRYDASGTAAGSEFRVNTFTSNDQFYSSITALSDGGFVVTWTSNGQDGSGHGIYGQRYDARGGAVGTEFQINQVTAGHQRTDSFSGSETVAQLADGRLVQTWSGLGTEEVFVRLIEVPAANTAPIIEPTPAIDGAVTEDGAASASGTLTASDPDAGTTLRWSIEGGTAASGADYHFTLDNLSIVRNGTTILNDPFEDGNPPPSISGAITGGPIG